MTYKELFEKETNKKMSDYIQRYVEINIKKYGNEITTEAFYVALDRQKAESFDTPIGFTKFFNAVARNISSEREWQDL